MDEDVDLPGKKKEGEKEKKKKDEGKKIKDKKKKKEPESPDFTIELVDDDGAKVTSPRGPVRFDPVWSKNWKRAEKA